jgi:hypothetical protein
MSSGASSPMPHATAAGTRIAARQPCTAATPPTTTGTAAANTFCPADQRPLRAATRRGGDPWREQGGRARSSASVIAYPLQPAGGGRAAAHGPAPVR